MPPRLPTSALGRAIRVPVPQLRAPISSSAKKQNLKDIGGFNSSRSLMEMDDASGPSDGALSGSSAGQRVADLMESTNAYTHLSADKEEVAERERKASWATPTNVRKMWPRPWAEGDVYAPHDLSRVEAAKWRKIRPVEMDRVDQLGINPLDHYKNFSIVSEFMTAMGRIQHSRLTGLRPVNQRKVAKAIRRAIGMGIHPSTHKHPNILFRNQNIPAPRYRPKQSAAAEKGDNDKDTGL